MHPLTHLRLLVHAEGLERNSRRRVSQPFRCCLRREDILRVHLAENVTHSEGAVSMRRGGGLN